MKRGSFNSRLGFILAASGSAVGLGNIWKFPFEVSNGGGAAFLLMYLFFCFILCFPVIVSEIAICRNTKKMLLVHLIKWVKENGTLLEKWEFSVGC